MLIGRLSLILLLLVFSLLMGCANRDAESIFDNYLYRLGNSLKADTAGSAQLAKQLRQQQASLLNYPPSRRLIRKVPRLTVNLLEFLSLSQCDLQRHVGQRNSSLGRVMLASQQLYYDIDFIILATDCVNVLQQQDPDSSTIEQLQLAIDFKQRYLPTRMWNASFATDEFRTLFSLASEPLGVEQSQQSIGSLVEAVGSLAFFNESVDSLLAQQQLVDQTQLEQHYALIASSKRIGQLRHSMRLVASYLKHADVLLQQRLGNKPLCLNATPNSRYKIVETVFNKFYIGEIQPYIAKTHQQAEQLFASLNRLLATLEPGEEFEEFWQQLYLDELSEWTHFNQAITSHTQQWQHLLKQCGRLPKV